MNLTPKKDYYAKSILASAHRDLVVSSAFREALNAALIQQLMDIPFTYDIDEAVAAYNRLMGARDFITHLLNLAEAPKTPTKPPNDNLDYKAVR